MTSSTMPATPSSAMAAFLTERHLATLTVVRPDGRPHVTPVGFTWDGDAGIVRVITFAGAVKVRLLGSGPLTAAVCQVDGARWATLEGLATVSADPARCQEGVARYTARYGAPRDRGADRRVIELSVSRILGRA